MDRYIRERRATERRTCLACSRAIAAPPQERTISRRGPIETIVDWHVCVCGALARLERRTAIAKPSEHDVAPSVSIGFFGSESANDEKSGRERRTPAQLGEDVAAILAAQRFAKP